MMTCKEVSTLVSIGQLDEAPPARRMAVRFHLMMCLHCRAFSRQLRVIGRVARVIAGDIEREPTSAFESRIIDRLGS
jgi:predicted anti-sigma-YlaC factor YlaD